MWNFYLTTDLDRLWFMASVNLITSQLFLLFGQVWVAFGNIRLFKCGRYCLCAGPRSVREDWETLRVVRGEKWRERVLPESLIDLNKPTRELMGCVILFSSAVPTIHHLSVSRGAGPRAIVCVIYRELHRGCTLSFTGVRRSQSHGMEGMEGMLRK